MTWDVRIKEPNHGDYLTTGVSHTIEHLFATYARNSEWSEHVVYVGPMGCLTGFYLLTTGLDKMQVLELVRQSFAWMASYDGPIPGASEQECGNYLMMDPIAARREASEMLEVLNRLDTQQPFTGSY